MLLTAEKHLFFGVTLTPVGMCVSSP